MQRSKWLTFVALGSLIFGLCGCRSLQLTDPRFQSRVGEFEALKRSPNNCCAGDAEQTYSLTYVKKVNGNTKSNLEYLLTVYKSSQSAIQKIENVILNDKRVLKYGTLKDKAGKDVGKFVFSQYLYKYIEADGPTRKIVFRFDNESRVVTLDIQCYGYREPQSYKNELVDLVDFAKGLPITQDIIFPSTEDIPDSVPLDGTSVTKQTAPNI